MPHPSRRNPILPALLAVCGLLHAGAAAAQVRRCTGADGGVVYTDRQCVDIGASERALAPAVGGATGTRLHRGCARSVQDLAFELSNAIHASDVNQLAGVYDWAGMSTANGYRLMTRLQAIAQRPLVDVQPMYSGGGDAYSDIVEFDADTGELITKRPRKPRLIGLRVEQTLSNGSTPSRTVFGLRKHLDCWWVRF